MSDPALLLSLLALLGIANGAPIAAAKLLQHRFATPVDGGLKLHDGRRLLGPSKTVRGIVASLFCTTVAAPLFSLDWTMGAVLAAASMAGDLASSFVKRRIGLRVHAQAVGLDHVPEALLPLLVLQPQLGLRFVDIAAVTLVFILLGAILTHVLLKFGFRERRDRVALQEAAQADRGDDAR